MGFLWYLTSDYFHLQNLAGEELRLRAWYEANPIEVAVLAFLLYAVVTALSIPGAAGMSLVYGWLFGVVVGTVIVSLASTTGASGAFLLSRYLFRERIRRAYPRQWEQFSAAWERDGLFYLLSLRLIPAVPFFLVNLLMGLTNIRLRTFWWVSQVGMFPATVAYLYAGSVLPSLQQVLDPAGPPVMSGERLLKLTLAGLALAGLPWCLRFIARRLRLQQTVELPNATTPEQVDSG
jgi:uncharacterized membrane protein YdjX (TVP38/TMEM64 family)